MRKDAKQGNTQHTSSTHPTDNQGEGDTKSAERFNKEEHKFVESEHGRAMIDKAGQVDASEEKALEDAERDGLSRAKGEDPAVLRKK